MACQGNFVWLAVLLVSASAASTDQSARALALEIDTPQVGAQVQKLDEDVSGLLQQVQALRGVLQVARESQPGNSTANVSNVTSSVSTAGNGTETIPEHKDGQTITEDWRREYPPFDTTSTQLNVSLEGPGAGGGASRSAASFATAFILLFLQMLLCS
mmetsp:Transcript_57069/g.105500  ORF Transcript_57069/g.105500 Transcript_57069/m.105500 type:complete len:158 (+) Transcript_57069:62-535(+)